MRSTHVRSGSGSRSAAVSTTSAENRPRYSTSKVFPSAKRSMLASAMTRSGSSTASASSAAAAVPIAARGSQDDLSFISEASTSRNTQPSQSSQTSTSSRSTVKP